LVTEDSRRKRLTEHEMQAAYTRAEARAQDFKLDPTDNAMLSFVARESDAPKDRTIVRGNQIHDIRMVFGRRHGQHLPDTAEHREQLLALLRLLADIPRVKRSTLIKEVEGRAPWMSKGDSSDMIDTARRTHRVHRKEKLGRIMRMTDIEREAWKVWSIWPMDLDLATSKLRGKERDRQSSSKRRRAAGAMTRSEYLEKVASPRPWVALNISESTYYRRQRKRKDEADSGSVGSITLVIDRDIRDSVEAYTTDEPSVTVEPAPVDRPSRRLGPRSAVIDEPIPHHWEIAPAEAQARPGAKRRSPEGGYLT
jgi:hypothetical protein